MDKYNFSNTNLANSNSLQNSINSNNVNGVSSNSMNSNNNNNNNNNNSNNNNGNNNNNNSSNNNDGNKNNERHQNKKKEKFNNKSKAFFTEERHRDNATPDLQKTKIAKWRMRERMKTVSVALVLCLNIGVDPPDVIKTYPCARMECWIDPASQPPQKSLDLIGKTLQAQYEKWQSKARYKQCLDPTVEEVKKLCLSLRRNAKEERVLFHYNGHGVPKPTTNGEIWVFNRNFTQYIPLSIYELQTWMGTPSIYVFDCSAAGLIINWFNQFAEQRDKELERFNNNSQQPQSQSQQQGGSNTPQNVNSNNNSSNNSNTNSPNMSSNSANNAQSAQSHQRDCILLAACSANEILPMNPDFPADMFTACLTTPIRIALRWFCSHSILTGITPDMLDRIPGNLSSRRTPLGELNWIFTAVTDTIAWNVLPRHLFQKLFRQDLLVASLFRNYLLAERIMRSANCTPISCPRLPPTYQHPMWQAWDLAADLVISQLPTLLADPNAEFKSSPFFSEQLTAFEVWLEFGSEQKEPPAQLPIVLQVLLSQAHRLRALVLLGKFLDLGPWAVNLALCVGIFPYVLKLLQSPAGDLRHILVFIWAKILALDKSCQLDLVKENGHAYFISVLSSPSIPADQRTMSAFVLSTICNNCRPGQNACLIGNLLPICLSQLSDPDPMVRRWMILCMAKMWENFEEAKWAAIKECAHEKLCLLLTDVCPEVRASAVVALGELIGGAEGSEQRTNIELNLALTLAVITADCSPMVRKELVIALSRIVSSYEGNFISVAQEIAHEERQRAIFEAKRLEELRKSKKRPISKGPDTDLSNSDLYSNGPQSSVYGCIWKIILNLCTDPFDQVANRAQSIVKRISSKFALEELVSHNLINRTNFNGNVNQYYLNNSSGGIGGVGLNNSNGGNFNVNSLNNSNGGGGGGLNSSTSSIRNTIVNISRITNRDPRSPAKTKLGAQRSPILTSSNSQVNNSGNMVNNLNNSNSSNGFYSNNSNLNSSANIGGVGNLSNTFSSISLSGSLGGNSRSRMSSSTPGNQSLPNDFLISDMMPFEEDELYSDYYEWSCNYFSKPMMQSIGEDSESFESVEKKWKRIRNEGIIQESKESVQTIINNPPKTFSQMSIFAENNGQPISHLQFHPFENVLIVSDGLENISIWNYDEGQRINAFNNCNMPGTKITTMRLVNDYESSMIITAADDGVVRLWRGYESNETLKMVSSWRAFPEFATTGNEPIGRLVLDWKGDSGLVMVSGETPDCPKIRIWDIERELGIQDILIGTESVVTCMTNEKRGPLFAAGFSDGLVKLFDQRVQSKYSCVSTLTEHKSYIVNISMPGSLGGKTVVSSSSTGEIKFWQHTYECSSNTILNNDVISSFTVHDNAPLIATGSQNQRIKIMNFTGEEVCTIRYHDGFLGQRIGPVSCLAFHPYNILMGAGATDSIVSIYNGDSNKNKTVDW
ncbi:hypothetical protein DICPUDRAFT_148338 [Dictyostelium purpureum]|uniref:Raptor N-terminal CASPase-like domain-containing protein n=1 Tax=Dictyostelium purpureum TaxID=5786 RepID=F0ZAV4_DICPU|nr:uncharacterized protein DICPUDRAFT_148338 [Dictyostelium purpureum]EGC38984.1 hypothetical protein DICPUDRAFT_148338 [Dictyostelium purpureum]|eukprot:XP_003284549.1 hypothetical protein DICPUDRAFT_148338 [Dictyostelium purpureum]